MKTQTQEQYVYKCKPKHCPQCLSTALADYVFGDPNDAVAADQSLPMLEQKYQVGGCAIELGECERKWHCKACRTDFYMKNNSILSME